MKSNSSRRNESNKAKKKISTNKKVRTNFEKSQEDALALLTKNDKFEVNNTNTITGSKFIKSALKSKSRSVTQTALVRNEH